MDAEGNLYMGPNVPAEDVQRAKEWAESLSELVEAEIDRLRLDQTIRNPNSLATITGYLE